MKKIIFCLFAFVVLSSCNDEFLNTTNQNSLDVSSFFQTENDVILAVNAAYTPLAHHGMFGKSYFFQMAGLDPYMVFESPNTGYDNFIFPYTLSKDNLVRDTWAHLYMGVYRTSDVLANIDRVTDMSEANNKMYKAQLKALRGMYYFYLVTLFHKPIYYDETNVPIDPLAGSPNGNPAEIWNTIEADLTYAAENLPDKWADDKDLGRITKGAANAQLGKSLLYKHYHYYLQENKGGSAEDIACLTKAKTALKDIIDGGNYKLILPKAADKKNEQAALLSNFSYIDIPVGANIYPAENNDESVWEVQYNDQRNSTTAAADYLPGWMGGGSLNYTYFGIKGEAEYTNFEFLYSMWKKFENRPGAPVGYEKDPRAYATMYIDGDTLDWRGPSVDGDPDYSKTVFKSATHTKQTVINNGLDGGNTDVLPSLAFGPKKYCYPQYTTGVAPKNAPFNVRVIRYADVLLMYAELSYLIDNDLDGTGLGYLNEVRARVGMPARTALTPTVIKDERTYEFAGEFHQFNDIIRWSFDPNFGIDFNEIYAGKFTYPKNLYWPIPLAEITSNFGVLLQNPGY